jgi:hypothetical protein
MSLASERIAHLAERLRLSDLPALLPAACEEAAAKERSFAEFAEELLGACAAAADTRATETIVRLAGFPARKTLEAFDFAFQPSLNRKQVTELASCAFVERAENVILLGPPGVGKSHIAIALGLAAAARRYAVKFTTAAKLVASLAEARRAGTFSRRGARAGGPALRGRFPPLRARLDRAYLKQELRRVGRGVLRRRRHRHGHPRPPAAPLHDDHHQGRELPSEGKEEGRRRDDGGRLGGVNFESSQRGQD